MMGSNALVCLARVTGWSIRYSNSSPLSSAIVMGATPSSRLPIPMSAATADSAGALARPPAKPCAILPSKRSFSCRCGRQGGGHRLKFVHGIAVRLGSEVGIEFRLDEWTWIVERLIEIHREGNGPSRDKERVSRCASPVRSDSPQWPSLADRAPCPRPRRDDRWSSKPGFPSGTRHGSGGSRCRRR